jgi:hypothetical protein
VRDSMFRVTLGLPKRSFALWAEARIDTSLEK